MKIITILGARPQFIKAAVVSREIRKKYEEVIVHTGQHYDYNMSEVFFEELKIPRPHYNLGVNGGNHGKMTGEMLIKIEEVLLQEKPHLVIVYGDTNSTLAGALAAVKLHIPVCHIEAGVRLGTLHNPEEVNRIVTDHVSNLLLCCTKSGVGFLEKEGIKAQIALIGDPMYDAFNYYSNSLNNISRTLTGIEEKAITIPDKYYYLTCHRPENTDNKEALLEILKAADSLDSICIYPVHPRNKEAVTTLKKEYGFNNIYLCEPVSYMTSIYLLLHCKKVITDSGGLQREAFFAKKQCITVFNQVIWPETMINNRNQLANAKENDILEKLALEQSLAGCEEPFGDGNSAKKIVIAIEDFFSRKV